MFKKFTAVPAAMLLAAALTACGSDGSSTSDGDPVDGGRLAVSIVADPVPLDPILQVSPIDRQVAEQVYEPLVRFTAKGEFEPGLATEWETEDGTAWTVTLRQDVTFSDGAPFNADAVVANVNRALTSPTCGRCVADLAFLEKVTAVDEDTVLFDLKTAIAEFDAYLTDTYFMMASPAAIKEHGERLGGHPVGTGPFVFKSRDAQGLSFDRNDSYWDADRVHLDGIDFKIVPDPQAAFAALQTGDLDVISTSSDTANQQSKDLPDYEVLQASGLGIQQVYFNMTAPPFDNPDARLAVVLATDREEILAIAHPGVPKDELHTVDGPWGGGMPEIGAAKSDKHPGHDLEKARELVKGLGGLRFELTATNVGGFPQLAQTLQAQWKRAGIDVQLDLGETNASITKALSLEAQAFLTTWSGRPGPDLTAYRYLHSGQINPSGISDPELDRLVDDARAELDAVTRAEKYQQVVDRVNEVLPALYFEDLTRSSILGPRVGSENDVLRADGVVVIADLWAKSK